MFVLIELITSSSHFKTIEKLSMERMTRSDEQLAFETLVSFAASLAGVTYCRVPRISAIWWRHKWYKARGSTWVVEMGIDQLWVDCVAGAWI